MKGSYLTKAKPILDFYTKAWGYSYQTDFSHLNIAEEYKISFSYHLNDPNFDVTLYTKEGSMYSFTYQDNALINYYGETLPKKVEEFRLAEEKNLKYIFRANSIKFIEGLA